jgi:hypothetical protein
MIPAVAAYRKFSRMHLLELYVLFTDVRIFQNG